MRFEFYSNVIGKFRISFFEQVNQGVHQEPYRDVMTLACTQILINRCLPSAQNRGLFAPSVVHAGCYYVAS